MYDVGPEKEKTLEQAFEKIMKVSLNEVPFEDMRAYIPDDFIGFGTTKDEVFFSYDDYAKLVKKQEEIAKKDNLTLELKRERSAYKEFSGENSAIITEDIDFIIKGEAFSQLLKARVSVIMNYQNGSWQMVHWHASVPADTEQDPFHIAEWKAEKEKLEKLVAEQTADLQQKNQELEIEAATQRVRAVAMGMKEPDNIMNVLNVMREEIGKFELENIATWIWTQDEEGWITQWDISEVIHEDNLANFNFTFDIKKYPQVSRHIKHWNGKEAYYELLWNGKELRELIHEVTDIDKNSGILFQEAVNSGQISKYWQIAAPYSKGIVGLDFVTEPPGDASPILTKMAEAFGMAYKRFEDLQKAEAQAREAKIEASLERIRGRAMALRNSDDLKEVVAIIFQELEKFELDIYDSNIIILNQEIKEYKMWGSGLGGINLPPSFTIPHVDHFYFNQVFEDITQYNQLKEEEKFRTVHLSGQTLKNLHEFYITETEFKHAPDEYLEEMLSVDEITLSYAVMEHGILEVASDEPLPNDTGDTLKRFAKVVDLTYTRFLDLKQAEQQAYESKVEASLERVRGMAAAMNHSDDLMQIAEAMFKEMEILKINPLRYGLGMIDGEKKEAELWASTVNDGHYLDMLGTLSLTWHPMLHQVLDAWDAQHEEVIYELKGKELSDYYQKIGEVNPDIPDLKALQDPKTEITQYVSFFPFKSGALYAFTDGKPGEEGRSILKRFANVFEQAHIRYNDLQKAEKQAHLIREERDRLEIALKELEATKDQLVQQEKLASLGQLTAGIAHEIKNPLNFVNNFSELSVELIEEAREELSAFSRQLSAKGEREKSKVKGEKDNSPFEEGGSSSSDEGPGDVSHVDEALTILDDIETNLKTIHKHGSRADSIVKSMLEHSRGGSGKMEPADLNGLVKEFVNLTFHGMRASKDPINVDMEFDLDELIGEVPLIAEDFSRVIINLCNNAFDAMREKSIQNLKFKIQNYSPKLTVRTQQTVSGISLEIKDNGPGIPEEMKDKILQPFFTTKKGTEGTGLGLSITNDIVKAHGGMIEINTTLGKGTQFKIQLPLKDS